MRLSEIDDIQHYLNKKYNVLMKKAKYLPYPTFEVQLCRGMVVPYCFEPFEMETADYFIVDIMDYLVEMLYTPKINLDYDNFCKLKVKYISSRFLSKFIYKKYLISGDKIKAFTIPKCRYDDTHF